MWCEQSSEKKIKGNIFLPLISITSFIADINKKKILE